MAEVPPKQIGRYEVLRVLGHGAFGTVYLARDPLLEREVALRVFPQAVVADEHPVLSLAKAHELTRLVHPNIAQIYDFGKVDGRMVMAVEYITGRTLRDVIRERTPLTFARKIHIFDQLCGGLAAAHHVGLIHGNVKPSKLMFDERGVLKIVDIELPRPRADVGITGTPGYMAPEQISGKLPDKRSDVFAAGAVFYEILAYRKAFADASPISAIDRTMSRASESLERLVPDIDSRVVTIVARCLQERPEDRYQDMALVRREVQAILEHPEAEALRRLERQRFERDQSERQQLERERLGPRELERQQREDDERRARESAARVAEMIARAKRALDAAEVDTAMRAVDELLQLEPENIAARQLRERVAATLEERRRIEFEDRRRAEEKASAERAAATPSLDPVMTRESPRTDSIPILVPQESEPSSLLTGILALPALIVGGVATAAATLAREIKKAAALAKSRPATGPKEPQRSTEPVLLGVAAPRQAMPGTTFTARFVAYVKKREAVVKDRLRQLDEAAARGNLQALVGLPPDRGGRWVIGAPVTVRVSGEFLQSKPETQSFEWSGTDNLVSFLISVPKTAPHGITQLCFEAFIEGVPIAFIPLNVAIGGELTERDRIVATARPLSSAFASYSSKDAPVVALLLSALKRWDPDADVFMDCLDLTPNENWQRQLEQVIPSKDAFLLFWSTNASKSRWVAWELQHARSTKGLEWIRPMPIDDPDTAPPPDFLRHLHFRDKYLIAREAFLRLDERRSP